MTRVVLVLLACLVARDAAAHGLDPALLSLRAVGPGVFDVTWHVSALRLPGADVRPELPAHCRRTSQDDAQTDGDRVTLRWTVDCGAQGLAGDTITVRDLGVAKINALVRIERPGGTAIQAVLSPRAPSFTVPERPSLWTVVHDYVVLGIEHILSGPDHLLFVLGLMLLVPTTKLLVQTITAFTLGHSITLSAAALGLAHVPSRPVEVLIAASVLLLATELARDGGGRSLLRRFPWVIAIAFGLLHGFGFAGALAEAGLPAEDVPLALASFNGGIELGQLAFVGTVLVVRTVLSGWIPQRSARPVVYAMGIMAAFWCFERIAAALS
ncbi:MAG TPA: HupE/UreJ family protein [Candidatus Binatia bacterium]|jgi:hypothetical protein|nr:HupE/UreJ family protein [Candidatus Binatia bacterium]